MSNEKLEISFGRKGWIYYYFKNEAIVITDYCLRQRVPKLFEKCVIIQAEMTKSEVFSLIRKKHNLDNKKSQNPKEKLYKCCSCPAKLPYKKMIHNTEHGTYMCVRCMERFENDRDWRSNIIGPKNKAL